MGRFVVIVSSLGWLGCHTAPESLRVAAAANTAPAFEALANELHLDARFSFGASGLLATQLEQGAPFDVFASADTGFVDRVVRAGVCDGTTRRTYAEGRLVAVVSPGVEPPRRLEDLTAARFTRIALANPEHAPFGRAAREALERAHVWDAVARRLVPAENVKQAQQFVSSGNAEVGLVARSLMADRDVAFVVDRTLHAPLAMDVVVCAPPSRRAAAQAFVDALTSERGQAVLTRFGFDPPPGVAAQ